MDIEQCDFNGANIVIDPVQTLDHDICLLSNGRHPGLIDALMAITISSRHVQRCPLRNASECSVQPISALRACTVQRYLRYER